MGGETAAAMSGLWGLEKKTSYRSGQRKTFTMWCNMKLVTAGCNTMSVDNMKDEMKNDDLNEVTSRFDQAISKFEAAKDEYGLVADSDQSENIQNCDDRIRECTEFIEN